jgi:hypothetical protein
MMTRRWIALIFLAAGLAAVPAGAQQRPLLTEDPEPIGTGRVLIEGGVDVALRQKYPASGLEGTLWRAPVLGVSIGLSPIAELQFDGSIVDTLLISKRTAAPLSNLLSVVGDRTHHASDLVVATKIRILAEGVGHPAIGLRLATKLPNASNESGLGTDTIDFYASLLIGKTVQSIRIVANGGIGILPDPVIGNRQNDVATYALSLARAITNQSEIVGEVNGRVSTRAAGPFPGSETSGQVAIGGRYTRGAVRFDGKVFAGLYEVDPRLGFSAGFTYVFNAVRVP